MLVQIFKAGEQEHFNTFSVGCHVIGRGPALQCNDKRVSRNHAVIQVTEEEVRITSTHINPCFLKVAGSSTITILKKDSSTQLNDGDTFALLPEDFWFKVKILNDENLDSKETNNETSTKLLKRMNSDDDEAVPDKKVKLEQTNGGLIKENEVVNIGENQAKEDEKFSDSNNQGLPEKEEPDENIPQENLVGNNTETEASSTKPEDGALNSDQLDDDIPSTSTSKSRRERCWYGAACYRKNPLHRSDFSHPGDSDFESDPDDNRPSCSFGADCYRTNKDHRRDYKHPPRQPKIKKKRNRKKVDRLNIATSEEMREFSDSEDPFIDDDDSDEYMGQSDTDDSEGNESQEVDEDSQNVKRLVKEANKFIKS